jgi:hypothetical protein
VPEDYASQFMLQEYTRIIDAYHDLHRQKDALIRLYLTFVSLPVSVIALFLALSRFFQANMQQAAGMIPTQAGSVLDALKSAGLFLSILLGFVGFAVLMVMLKIRGEQYLYVKTINGARRFFKEKHGIDAERYLVLPSNINQLTFGQDELSGRAFWESMIVAFTNSMLFGFLAYELAFRLAGHRYCAMATAAVVFLASVVGFRSFIRGRLKSSLLFHGLSDVTTLGHLEPQSTGVTPRQTPQQS